MNEIMVGQGKGELLNETQPPFNTLRRGSLEWIFLLLKLAAVALECTLSPKLRVTAEFKLQVLKKQDEASDYRYYHYDQHPGC